MKPKRIQRKRTKGWRMPPNTVYVGRPTKFGNPFQTKHYSRQEAVDCFEAMINGKLGKTWEFAKIEIGKKLHELKGKNLACWCPLNQPCHADILLEIANK